MSQIESTLPLAANEPKSLKWLLATYLVAISIVKKLTTPYMALATIAYCLILSGVIYRRNRFAHVSLMASGALLDLSLVGVLEAKRAAIETAVGGSLSLAQMCHIGFSLLAVLLYFPAVVLGTRAVRARAAPNSKLHRYVGMAAFCCRTLGFVMMFSMLEHLKK